MSEENQSTMTSVSEVAQPVKNGWSSVQVYALSVVCLLIGVTTGYLVRGSSAGAPGAGVSQPQIGAASTEGAQAGGAQAGSIPPGNAQPTPEQMKQMADTKVAPMLEKLKANPNDTDTLTTVGTIYLAAGQFDESAKYFEKLVAIKPTADSWTKLSNAQAYGHSADKAMASLNKALEIDPKFANALYNMGMIKWQAQGDVKGAIACWEKLVKTNPNHPQLDQVKKLIAHAKEEAAKQSANAKP